MARMSYKRGPEIYVNATQVGTATITGDALDMSAFDQVDLEIELADGTGTAALVIYAETTDDLSGTPVYHRLQSVSWAGGTGTLVDAQWSHATGGAAANLAISLSDVNAHAIRFVFSMADGGATDLLTVHATRKGKK